MKHVALLDATGLLYRAFHGIPPMRCASGLQTNAVYGFTDHLIKQVQMQRHRGNGAVIAVFDPDGPSFREELLPSYKADRERPVGLDEQFAWAKRVCDAMSVPWLEVPGYEADDVIATLSRSSVVDTVEIVSVDKDMLQLVNERVKCFDPFKSVVKGINECLEKFGVMPAHVTDVQALMGDTSDGIPGVRGIGQKTAAMLIQEWGDLETLIKAVTAGKVRPAYANKIRDTGYENIRLYQRLATLVDVPLDPDRINQLCLDYRGPDMPNVRSVFSELEFNRHLATMEKAYG